MSNVGIKDASGATRAIDTFVRTEGPGEVETQAVAVVNPVTGDPLLPTPAGAIPVDVAGELLDAIEALRMTVHSLSRSIGLMIPDASGRMRAVIETGSTVAVSSLPTLGAVTTVSTVSTVTNQGQVGGLAANDQIHALLRISAAGLRNNILVT